MVPIILGESCLVPMWDPQSFIVVEMNGNGLPTHLSILDEKNYDAWCIQMKVIFRMQDALESVMIGL